MPFPSDVKGYDCGFSGVKMGMQSEETFHPFRHRQDEMRMTCTMLLTKATDDHVVSCAKAIIFKYAHCIYTAQACHVRSSTFSFTANFSPAVESDIQRLHV